MVTLSKPIFDPIAFGFELRKRRKNLGFTLEEISKTTSIDVGQLSRFERGDMKLKSRNLQKFIEHLQKLELVKIPVNAPDVVHRFAAIVHRSERHAAAATAFVNALENLM